MPDRYDGESDAIFSDAQREEVTQIVKKAIVASFEFTTLPHPEVALLPHVEIVSALADVHSALDGFTGATSEL